jgi:hypothetical protein
MRYPLGLRFLFETRAREPPGHVYDCRPRVENYFRNVPKPDRTYEMGKGRIFDLEANPR